MIGIFSGRNLRGLGLGGIGALAMTGGLSAETMTPELALIIFVGALFVGWSLHIILRGVIHMLFSFWTPLLVMGAGLLFFYGG